MVYYIIIHDVKVSRNIITLCGIYETNIRKMSVDINRNSELGWFMNYVVTI